MARSPSSARSTPPAPSASPSRTPWRAVLALVVLGIAVYANALGGPFLLDDQRSVRENTSIQDLGNLGAVLHPPVQSPVTGRPIPNLAFALNYAAGGDAVTGYHAANIAIHILAALAIFGLLRRTLPRMTGATAPTSSLDLAALAAAALWLVHPVNSESVNYVTQRTESLMGLFFVTAMWAAVRALDSRRPVRWELAAMLAAFCATGSKETALTLPLVLVLWDRAFGFDSFAAAWAARKRLYGLVLASWLLFVLFARELPFFAEKGFQLHVSRWVYLLHQGPMILRYFGLVAWPDRLVFDYGPPGAITLAGALPAVLVVAALGVFTLVAMTRWPRLGFWGAWFFITLAPASSFIPIPTEVGAERRMYLPLIAVMVLVVWLLRALLQRLPSPALRTRLGWATALIAVVALGAATSARNRDYQDGLTLWQTSLDRWPQPRAHEHLSMMLRDQGRLDESVAHLRLALPDSPNARHALASALLERGELQEAITHFREYVRQWPDDPHIILGREEFAIALLQAKDAAGAAEQFRAIIATEPNYARARIGLGDALIQLNQLAAARDAYAEAVRLQPDNALALRNLAVLQKAGGDTRGAVASLRSLLKVDPRDVGARQQLVQLLVAAENVRGVETELQALIALTPQDPMVYNLLGASLAAQGRVAPAREAFEKALALNPNDAQARANLARLR